MAIIQWFYQKKMSVEIKGIPEVLNKLESVYGKQAMQAKSDKALNEASEFFYKGFKERVREL